jgi:hypothetical protein
MMSATVYFIDFRGNSRENFLDKLERLLETAGLSQIIDARELVAVKLHFGERGNTAFIRPIFIRKIVQCVKQAQGVPFLTDTNTLYAGSRSDAPHHLRTAIENGFAYSVVDQTPVIIADGLRGRSETALEIGRKHFQTAYIANEIVQADVLVSVAHFKGHELAGFGGTLKNLAMGCASRKGKLAQHSTVSPKVKRKKCIACGHCIARCPVGAITLVDGKAKIDNAVCIGCGECIQLCPCQAIAIRWNQSIPVFLEGMAEYSLAVLQNKRQKSLFINFISDVSPACDCHGYNDAAIVGNIGVLASTDPVAIDQAAVDLVNQAPPLPGTALDAGNVVAEDKFRTLYPEVDGSIQLAYAEELGLGTRDYQLKTLESLTWEAYRAAKRQA